MAETLVKGDSRKTLIESGGDGTSKSSVGTTVKNMGEKSGEPHLKSYLEVEWTLIYDENEGNLILILTKSESACTVFFCVCVAYFNILILAV